MRFSKLFKTGSLFIVASLGALLVACTPGGTTTTTSPTATSDSDGGPTSTTTTTASGPISVDFLMASSQCLTPCAMGAPVLLGGEITIEAAIKNGDPTQSYSIQVPNGNGQSSAYLEYNEQDCFCDNDLSTSQDCSNSCPIGANKIIVVSAYFETENAGSVSFSVVDDEGNVAATSSFDVEPAAGVALGVANSLTLQKPGADGAFSVPVGASLEVTYSPTDANGVALMFTQNGLSATFSNPSIVGPTTPADENSPAIALGTNNLIFATAGVAGDASIGIAANGNGSNAGVTGTVSFHVTQ